ncbi:MAG: hypothetical protein JEY96_00735 [Bacteroidales bacterium]|nr:hypothetical protein [Bacteroidales bacterium]
MKLNKKAHSVKQLSIEVEYPELKSAKDAQDKVLSIVKNKLVDILERACDNYGSDSLIRIKKLTLDLGDIQFTDISTQLPQAFEKKINQIFSGFNSNIFSTKELGGVEVINEEEQLLIYFTYYIKYGTIPWYMQDVIGNYTFDEIFTHLIDKNTESFQKEFLSAIQYPNARKRLLRYFDSGEVWQFLKNNLQAPVYSNIQMLNKELSYLISLSTNIESVHKGYLLSYLKEFLLVISSDSRKKNQSFTLEQLTKKYVDFIAHEKNISPENWLPSIFVGRPAITQASSSANTIILAMQEDYTNYLLRDKPKILVSKLDKIEGKIQFETWLMKIQPIAGTYLSKAIKEIVKNISKSYPFIAKTKIEQIVWDASAEIISDISIAKENVSKWVYAITQHAQKMFGFSEYSTNKAAEQVVKLESTKDSKRKKEIPDLESLTGFNILIAREYLSLFLKSSLTPFKKLYQNPAKELKRLFSRYLEEDSEAKSFIIEQVEDSNLMALWRVKEYLGDDLFIAFKKIIKEERKDLIPEIVEYDYLILLSFIRNGTVSWTELIEKGRDEITQVLEQYFKKEKRSILTRLLVQEDFFKKQVIMEKVFDTLSIEPARELLKIRKELIESGKIDDLEFVIKDESKTEIETEVAAAIETESIDAQVQINERVVDSLANYILEFGNGKLPLGITQKNQANFIFDEIIKSARQSLYETAAMLTSIDKKVVDTLLVVFDDKQKDYLKKLIQNYRTRFFNIAEEIKESEKREDQLRIPVSEREMAEGGETFYVNNAGLVLLSVYMKRLFSRFDLIDKKEFKSDEAREKAIYLLQYLAAKDDNPGEHELALNKILVGMPLGIPLKFNIKLSDEEKEICESLLDAVVKNWTVLKNTSADGLRTSFLLRKGSLKKEANGWKLMVEKKTYDLLLGKLPWGYSMIHLPWMKHPVLTEWED